MNNLIQLCGLPRSGTGFMSIFLSLHPDCITYHELITKSDNYRAKIEGDLKKYKYVIDCSTYGFLPQCSYPESKKVFIKRNYFESRKRAELALGTFIPIEDYHTYNNIINKWLSSNEVFEIDYSILFNEITLKRIWVYCFDSDEYFSFEKATHFIGMNIQMQKPKRIIEDIVISKRINSQLNK